MIQVDVTTSGHSYPVLVGDGAIESLRDLIPLRAQRIAVVTQANIPVGVDLGRESRTFLLPPGEDAKSMAVVESLCRDFARWGLTRADAVVAVGGGVVTDTAGFAAAVYHRGVDVIHVPTTLLAQVDAAIGGKTGVNLPEGKNLIGAFWQPIAVVCDTATLATLPPRELASGRGEMAKYHFLSDEDLDDLPLDARIARCVALKAAVVGADEHERSGVRATLNYGHTLGHALEIAGHHGLRHGEAVAVGLVYAAELARALGRVSEARVADHRRVVAGYDLPATIPSDIADDDLVELMRRDKKSSGGLTFVLDGPDGPELVSDVPEATVREVLGAVR